MTATAYDRARADLDAALSRLRTQVARLMDPRAPRTMRSERITRRHPRADVLLVEDDPFAGELGAYLRAHLDGGATVRVVQRAEEALQLAGSGTWGVAVLDLHLGHARITGLDVLAALPASTPVVLVTGVTPNELPQIAREARVDAHLTKPFSPDVLARAIDTLRARRAATETP